MHSLRKCSLSLAATFSLLATPVLAGGGNVLPSSANTKGYSLAKSALATALYNSGQATGNPATPAPPALPFQILVSDVTVKPGTTLFLPVFFVDDSAPVVGTFPANFANLAADAAYFDQVALELFGVEQFFVEVDGKDTLLDDSYVTAVTTPPLLDGTPAGTHYISIAAYLTPLTPGVHSVSIGGIVDGQPVIFITDTVTVK